MIVRGKGMQTVVERNGTTETIRSSPLSGSEITFAAVRSRAGPVSCRLPAAQSVISVTTQRFGSNPLCVTTTRSHSNRQLTPSGCSIERDRFRSCQTAPGDRLDRLH